MFAVVNKNNGALLLNKEARDLFQDPYVNNTPFLLFYDAGYVHLYYLNTLRQYRIVESTLRLPDTPDHYLDSISTTKTKILLHYKYYDGKDLVRSIDQRRYPE